MINPFRKITHFSSEMVLELKKASWPTWLELRDSTVVVVIGIMLLACYVTIIDFSLYQIVTLVSTWVKPILG